MRTQEVLCRLRALEQEHPRAHPYTLALKLQEQTGWVISGLKARQLLEDGHTPEPWEHY